MALCLELVKFPFFSFLFFPFFGDVLMKVEEGKKRKEKEKAAYPYHAVDYHTWDKSK